MNNYTITSSQNHINTQTPTNGKSHAVPTQNPVFDGAFATRTSYYPGYLKTIARMVTWAFSVIPLVGSGDNAKAPALKSWKQYQRQPATTDALRGWFGDDTHKAYGVVCGAVSQLVVIDIDDPALIKPFKREFPDLLNTFTVRTGGRGGLHLYYRADFPVKSRALKGADIKGEGGYVVGANSQINGGWWEIVHDPDHIHAITPDDLNRIIAFFKSQPDSVGIGHDDGAGSTRTLSLPTAVKTTTTAHFANRYRKLVATTHQRNNVLFKVAVEMRDAGYTRAETENALGGLHAAQSPFRGHHKESYDTRLTEAYRTIQSAFSRPRRRSNAVIVKNDAAHLPNTLRETLLNQPHGALVLRLLEGLALLGFCPGDTFTRNSAAAALSGVLGKQSVRHAVNFTSADGTRLLPPNPPNANADVSVFPKKKSDFMDSPNAKRIGGKKESTKAANVAEQFTYPTLDDLYARLKLDPAPPGDPVTLDDLRSSAAYRRALNTGLIARRPGKHDAGLLASRLGVTKRCLRNYHRQSREINRAPRYDSTSVTRANVHHLYTAAQYAHADEDDLSQWGHFLEDDSGKRYPPYFEIAVELIKSRQRVVYRRQTANCYWLGDPNSPPDAHELNVPPPVRAIHPSLPLRHVDPEATPQPTHTADAQPENINQPRRGASMYAPANAHPTADAQPENINQPRRGASMYAPANAPAPVDTRPPTEPQRRAAAAIHAAIPQITPTSAEKLVAKFGHAPVKPTLKRVLWLHREGRIRDLRGYFVRALANESAKPPRQDRKRTPQPPFRRPLPDAYAERTAAELHAGIPTLSQQNARNLVHIYGVDAVKTALRRVLWLDEQGKVSSAAGLFITVVRLVWWDANPVPHSQIPTFRPVRS